MKATFQAGAAGTVRVGDIAVNRLGFGAMRLIGPNVWGRPKYPENAVRVLRLALELGVTFIDTADAYGPAVNEEQIAEALYPYPDGVLIATKGGVIRPGPGKWEPDCRPERLKQCCEASLKRLRTDRIDLYQLHTVDPKVPFAEQIGALGELRDEGKIRYIGLSNVDAEHVRIARSIAPIASVQNRYSLADRDEEAMVKTCEREGMVFIPWFPLAAGDMNRSMGLQTLAREKGCSPNQFALAWLLKRSPAMLPIPGTANLSHLRENVAAASLAMTDAECERAASLVT